jgi:hypothetical protein
MVAIIITTEEISNSYQIFVRNPEGDMAVHGRAKEKGLRIRPGDKKQNKLRGLSPRANYTDRAAAACRRIYCQLLRIEGATWSA